MVGNGAVYSGGGGDPNQTQKLKFNQPLVSVTTESSLGSKAMLSFGGVSGVKRSGNFVLSSCDQEEFGDEYLDEYLNQQEKKRRLTVDQVQFLERSFKADNKLEPERKIQLANELGLQPRQIAVWFQNRRARWKTKHLETDYETLHARYETLKTDYDSLLKENYRLKAEVVCLKQNRLGGYTKKANLLGGEADAGMIPEDEESALAFKNEEQSSARSEVADVDSPRLSDRTPTPRVIESGVTSGVFDPNYSYSSQNGEDKLHEELLQPAHAFPMIEDAQCHLPVSSFCHGFQDEDHAFNFWS